MKDVPLNRNAPFEYYIMDKADNITIPFELIVCFHYICEQLAENPDVDPLEGTIPKDPNYSNLYSL